MCEKNQFQSSNLTAKTGQKSGEKKPVFGVHLGSIAKSSSLQENQALQPVLINGKRSAAFVDISTGEIVQDTPEYNPVSVRLERFALQSSVRYLLPDSRTAKCLRILQANKKEVEVWRSFDHGSACYAGLQICSSVWSCPVCAAKISERRRVELLHAMEQHQANGGYILLLTLTNPHTRTDDLQAMLKAQALAMSRFNGTKSAQALWVSIGCIGTVRAWEVTHGDNGWHPHFHILLFLTFDLNQRGELLSFMPHEEMTSRFYAVWANCCRLAKLPIPSEEHGVRLDDGAQAANYVSKGLWGLDREMTKGHLKKSKHGRSPFDLLRSYLYDQDRQAGALFCDYARSFKGKRQLVWSKGLKALFEIKEQTDEEAAAKIEDDAYLLGKIQAEEWLLIRKFNVRGEVLELARHGWEPVRRFLDSLVFEEKRKVFDERKCER